MSLPRYLRDIFGNWYEGLDKLDLLQIGHLGFKENAIVCYKGKSTYYDLLLGYFRKTHRPISVITSDCILRRYTGHKDTAYPYNYLFVIEPIPNILRSSFQKLEDKKLQIKKREQELLIGLKKYIKRIYMRRTFPPKLRSYILLRDKYRCVHCGVTAEVLKKQNKYLVVDHIIPYVDGGQTTLNNGQTLCADCNFGKHHVKYGIKF